MTTARQASHYCPNCQRRYDSLAALLRHFALRRECARLAQLAEHMATHGMRPRVDANAQPHVQPGRETGGL